MKMFYELPMVNLTDDELFEKMRVRELVEYERYCCDYGHKEEQRSCWHEDGQLFTTWFKGPVGEYLGNSTIAPKPVEMGEPIESHNHRINNTVIWLKNNRAIAEMLCYLTFRTKLGWDWMDTQCWCRMHVRAEKRNGKWGLVYFEGIYEKDRMDPVFGDSKFKIPREELKKYRPINWNMAMRRGAFLGHISNSEQWAGADKPETIAHLYEESSRWIGLE
jgi:hypothetical protein